VVPRRSTTSATAESTSSDSSSSAADENQDSGLGYDDLRWLLERVPAEILILRPAPEDTRQISANAVKGHF
jgi:hypothetical protein